MNFLSKITILLVAWAYLSERGLAQSIVPSANDTGTIVTSQGDQLQIRGGTVAGSNLFHSFDRFNLNANETATFFASPIIQNILARVSSGEVSRINGLLQVNSNANLILMNPAGILFGSTARLDVPASFTATTAQRIGIGEGKFNAIGKNDYLDLTKTPFSFEAMAGGIFNAGNLTAGQSIFLLGGTVLNIGELNGQRVSIVAVPENRQIRVTPQGSLLSFDLPVTRQFAAKSLPELLTGGDLEDATQATIKNGIPELTQAGTAIVSGKITSPVIQIAADRIGLIDENLSGEAIRIGGGRRGLKSFPASQFLFGSMETETNGGSGGNDDDEKDDDDDNNNNEKTNNNENVNNNDIDNSNDNNYDDYDDKPIQPDLETEIIEIVVPLSPPKTQSSDRSNSSIFQPNTEVRQIISSVVDLEGSISREYTQYYELESSSAITLQEIQNTLNKVQERKKTRSAIIYSVFVPSVITPAPKTGETLIDQSEPITPLLRSQLKRDDDRLDLILVTATGKAIRYSTSATRAQIAQQAKLYRLAVSDAEDDLSYLTLSKQFYSWLLQPLEAELQRQGIQGLIYCLDEGLRTVSIAAMSNDREFVTDRYSVSVIPSVTLLNRELHSLSNQTVLAMGADTFQNLEPLPAVPTELKLISEQFWRGRRLLNQNFTLEQLLQERQQHQAGILHLATHAKFKSGKPEQSFIQLWNQQIKLNQMTSIAWANPPLHLLVLSACETAIDSSDAELGFTGLAAATGVHSVMGSLWEISDIGTLAFMSEFYIQLRQAPTRAEALRRAQAALRNGTVRIENGTLITSKIRVPLPETLGELETRSFQHPFYWAAFTLVGNPW